MNTNRNIGFVLIGDNTSGYTSATRIEDIADGEIAAVDKFGAVITTSTDALGKAFRLVQGRGSGLRARSTDLIVPGASGQFVKYVEASEHVNPAEQITDIGYNLTSGSLDSENSTRYTIRFNLIETDRTGFAQSPIVHGTYYSDTDATQWEIARELSKNINMNVAKMYERPFRAVATIDTSGLTEAASMPSAGDHEITVVQDSDVVNEGAGSWVSTPVVGELLTLDSSEIAYEIVEVLSSTSVRIHMPYQGASVSDAQAVTYTAASVTDADPAGIRVTGEARTKSFSATKPGHWSKVRWETQLEGFGDTTLTATQAPTEGYGNYQQVAKEEYLGESIFGNRYRKDHLFEATVDTDLSGATYYGCISLRWEDPHFVSGVGPQPASHKHAKLWLGDAAADSSWSSASNQAADLLTIINTCCGTSAAF